MKEQFPQVYFGEVSNDPPVDWRARLRNVEEFDDDEELEETPEDVIGMLGFDPLDYVEEIEEVVVKGGPGSGNRGHAGRPGHVGGSGVGEEGGEDTILKDGEGKRIENDSRELVQNIWNKSFPGKSVKIEADCMEGDDKVRMSVEFSAKGFSGAAGMMSTMYPESKTIIHDDYFLDDDKFKGHGFASAYMRYMEKVAEEHGCTKAILQASDQGRYTWPQLGFKCSSRKQFKEIQEFGEKHGIEIRNEKDFIKLKPFFDKSKQGDMLHEDIMMKKPVGIFPVKKKDIDDSEVVLKSYDDKSLTLCPVCGEELVLSEAGLWCVNSDCIVTDNPYDFLPD